MSKRDWNKDWELANAPLWKIDWCHTGSPTEIQQALRYYLQRVREVEDDRNTEKRLRKDAEDRAAKLEERVRELESQCAAMREALDWALTQLRTMPVEKVFTKYGLKEFKKKAQWADNVLMNNTAGRELLERVEKLEGALQKMFGTSDIQTACAFFDEISTKLKLAEKYEYELEQTILGLKETIHEQDKRINKLEAEAEAARDCYQRWHKGDRLCTCDYPYKCRIWPKLGEVLAALKKGGNQE